MRLTKEDKQAFVRAVMDDVPSVDYDEQVRTRLKEWGFSALPPILKAAASEFPDYFETRYIPTPIGCPGAFVICPPHLCGPCFERAVPEVWAELVVIGEKQIAQSKAHAELRSKVTALINSCTTLKQAQERLPEFAKYLPANRDGSFIANLPVANTLVDLQKAGWPKGGA